MNRYETMFSRTRSEDRCAFIPFVQLGDPHTDEAVDVQTALNTSFRQICALVDAGADALELGLPFSDPVADGPTIQAASQRALRAGVTPELALSLASRVRQAYPVLPIGLLVYANLVMAPGLDAFYEHVARAGIDSVLVADVPLSEGGVFSGTARQHGVAPVFIATPDCTDLELHRLAQLGAGYSYVVTRAGVTGADQAPRSGRDELVGRLAAAGAPPPVFGFGISTPGHVRSAVEAGAAGVISGSAIVEALRTTGVDKARELVQSLRGSSHQ